MCQTYNREYTWKVLYCLTALIFIYFYIKYLELNFIALFFILFKILVYNKNSKFETLKESRD